MLNISFKCLRIYKKAISSPHFFLLFTVASLLSLGLLVNSCQVFDVISGANIDEQRFALHREAKIKEIRVEKSTKVLERITKRGIFENSDISMILSEDLINDFVKCYDGTKGYLNYSTSYTVDSTQVKLLNGAAVATIFLKAYEASNKVNVNMVMDALITFRKEADYLVSDIEPFNITPIVDKSVLVLSKDALANLIKINTADMNKNLPPMKIPLTQKGDFKVDKIDFIVKDNINFQLKSDARKLVYNLQSNEPLILDKKMIINLYIENLKVE